MTNDRLCPFGQAPGRCTAQCALFTADGRCTLVRIADGIDRICEEENSALARALFEVCDALDGVARDFRAER